MSAKSTLAQGLLRTGRMKKEEKKSAQKRFAVGTRVAWGEYWGWVMEFSGTVLEDGPVFVLVSFPPTKHGRLVRRQALRVVKEPK